MKKSKYLILILLLIFIMSIATISEATNNQYQKWLNLSDEEKQEVIQPTPYALSIEEGIKVSNQKKYAVLKESMQTKYFLADDITIDVKNQKTVNTCWAFSAISSLETNIAVKTKKVSSIYSSRHMDYATSRTFKDNVINSTGFNREVGDGGNAKVAFAYFTNGTGPVLETNMPFEDNEDKIDISEISKNVDKQITDYAEFASIDKEYDSEGKLSVYTNGYIGIYRKEYTQDEVDIVRTQIKQHIKENGAITAYTYSALNSTIEVDKYYNYKKVSEGSSTTYAYYCNDTTKSPDHAITIVGWDDSYSKSNFSIEPKNDGAYIVLNSWGDQVLNNGYMYVSYDDVNIETMLMGISGTEDIDYDTLYQHDEYGYSYAMPFYNSTTGEDLTSIYAANVFERDSSNKPTDGKNYDEYINEVSISLSQASDIQILVNSEDDDLTKVQVVATPGVLESGYHTVKLSSPIKLTGDKFVVAVRYSNSDGAEVPFELNYKSNGGTSNYWDFVTSQKGESYIGINTQSWQDIMEVSTEDGYYKDINTCIKAFTTFEEVKDILVESVTLNETSKTMQIGDIANLEATIKPTDATNKNVKWSSSDETVATVSEKGIITAKKEGTATITVTSEEGNKIATCKITVQAKTSTDDDKYITDDSEGDVSDIVGKNEKDKIVENSSNNTDNTNSNKTNNTSTNKEKTNTTNDTTLAKTILPYTGKITLIAIVVVILISGIVIFIKYTTMKDIK